MARATFSLYGRGNPRKKVGTVYFLGKSWKKARAAGARYLRGIGVNPAGPHLSVCVDPDFERQQNRRRAARTHTRSRNIRRKKNENFGQRMARLKAKKKVKRRRR